MPRVLIVEDDQMNARLFEVILRKIGGFQVYITSDVEEVVRLTVSGQVDVILMDVSLSNAVYMGKPTNGLEISRLLKEDARTRELPILLATAHSMKGDRERFLAVSKADDYIAKPVTDHRLFVERVSKHLEPRGRAAGADQRKTAAGGGARSAEAPVQPQDDKDKQGNG